MSDPKRVDGRSTTLFQPVPPEPEDMSVFLHNLLHAPPAGLTTTGGGGGSSTVLDYRGSGATLNFSDPGCFFESEAGERVDKGFYSAASGDCDAAGTSSSNRREERRLNKGYEASEDTRNRVHSNSSKRIRSAEVHNMSEKRRRSKINEKLKALQNLVPNSNKTDKASMLDEAIEYLKQLQLHVQMLTIRNGLSLHPNYVPGGCLPSMQLPVDFDAGIVLANSSRGVEAQPGNQQPVMPSVFGTHNPKIPGHQLAVPAMTNNSSSGMSFGAESTLPSHFGLFNHLPSSAKDLCREETQPNFTLDASCSRNKSTSGVSS